MMRRVHMVMLGMLAVAVMAGAAHAQPAPADPAKIKLAGQYADAGVKAQEAGDYDTAIAFYTKAYEQAPHPSMFYNMAQAHRLAGRADQAIALYKRYLAEAPSGPQAPSARERIAELDAQKAEQTRKLDEARKAEAARKDLARLAEEARLAELRRHQPPTVATGAPGATARTAPATTTAERSSGQLSPQQGTEPDGERPARTLRLAGLTTGGVGAASLAVGIGFGLHARSLGNQLSKPGAVYDPAKIHAGQHANTIAITGMVGGGVLLAAGGAMYWLGHRQGDTEWLSFAPIVSDHLAGVVVSGSL